MSKLQYATTNSGKLQEAQRYLDSIQRIEQFDYDYLEIQSDDLTEIARRGASEAFEQYEGDDPVIVDDTGLFIDAFDGFPGPYSAYVENTLGIERVWKLTEPEDNHLASFRCAIGYCDNDTLTTFEGVVQGTIVSPQGSGGFGYDPIFEHNGTTFAEMSVEQKNAVSHRGRALAKLAESLDE
ncbi:MAG: RdgB/HAM1 family non-canonical purine NTP pyrophosphatase [Halobacteriaceae archaeon]